MPQTEGGADAALDQFEQLLNKQGLVRVLDQFLTYEDFAQTQDSLIEMTGLTQPTVSRRVNDLVDLGMVKESDGTSSKEYRLDMDHPAVPKLVDVHTKLHNHVQEIHRQADAFDPGEADANEGSPFVELFRYPTNVKLLTAFLQYPQERIDIATLADLADVDYTTASDNINLLCQVGIVESIESELRDTEYELNGNHPAKDGFERVIEALREDPSEETEASEESEEPATPTDKDAISARDHTDRAEDIRKKLQDLVDEVMDENEIWEVAEEWTQSAENAQEAYSRQLRAGEVSTDDKPKPPEQLDEPPELASDDNKAEDDDDHHRFGRTRFSGTSHHGSGRTNTAAA